MYVLLKHLRRARREIALPVPRQRGSLALRHVDAGSCNGCEHELTATANPFYDLQRFGLNVVASPRHADVLLVTGQVTTRMRSPLLSAYEAMPQPRLVAALGDCALGCGVLGERAALAETLEEILHIDLRIPGCPPTPERIAEALLELMLKQRPGRRARRIAAAGPQRIADTDATRIADTDATRIADTDTQHIADSGAQVGAPYS